VVFASEHRPFVNINSPGTKPLTSRKQFVTNPAKSLTNPPKSSFLVEAAEPESDATPRPTSYMFD
jgi:hypothetical protein